MKNTSENAKSEKRLVTTKKVSTDIQTKAPASKAVELVVKKDKSALKLKISTVAPKSLPGIAKSSSNSSGQTKSSKKAKSTEDVSVSPTSKSPIISHTTTSIPTSTIIEDISLLSSAKTLSIKSKKKSVKKREETRRKAVDKPRKGEVVKINVENEVVSKNKRKMTAFSRWDQALRIIQRNQRLFDENEHDKEEKLGRLAETWKKLTDNPLNVVGCIMVICVGSIIPVASIIIGALNSGNCRAEPKIPWFLLVNGICSELWMLSSLRVYSPCRKQKPESKSYNLVYAFDGILNIFLFVWFILGSAWVFGTTDADYVNQQLERYCDKTTYYFAYTILVCVYSFCVIAFVVWVFTICIYPLFDKNIK